MPETTDTPQGVLAVLVDRGDGRVVCHTACFEPGGASGFFQIEAQRIRARDAIGYRFLETFGGPRLAKLFGSGYELNSLLQRATHPESGEFRLTYIPIGYSPEEAKLL